MILPKRQSIRPTSASLPSDNKIGPESVLARTAVSLEYTSLRYNGHCPLGIYVSLSPTNILIWDAVFFVHQGYYADSILKFRLTFPTNYPEHPPTVDFVTDVFHPLVGQNGSFNLMTRFRPWKPKEHHVFDVLHWVKVAFKKHVLDQIQESDCSNKEAYRYHESTQSFAALATQTASLSRSDSALFDSDHHSSMGTSGTGFVFFKLSPEQLQQERSRLGLQAWDDLA